MENLYDILGVGKDATEQELKKARRDMLWKHHPDHAQEGARQEELTAKSADINKAFDVLSDPEKRKEYDETGGYTIKNSPEEKAEELLMAVFAQALGNSNTPAELMSVAKQGLSKNIAMTRESLKNCNEIIAKREKQRKSFERKGGKRNLLHMVIDQQTENMKRDRVRMKEDLEILGLAIKLLDEFEFSDETMNVIQPTIQTTRVYKIDYTGI